MTYYKLDSERRKGIDMNDLREHLDAQYAMPIEEIPGTVYAIHYVEPTIAKSVGTDYGPAGMSSHPITHYVGWTHEAEPYDRIREHQAEDVDIVVDLWPESTMEYLSILKHIGACDLCGEPYVFSRESEWRKA